MERGLGRIKKLPCIKRLHDRNPHAFFFTSGVEGISFGNTSDGVVPMPIIIHWIDGEHHHINDLHIKHLICQCRCMCGKPKMLYHALFFHGEQEFQYTIFI